MGLFFTLSESLVIIGIRWSGHWTDINTVGKLVLCTIASVSALV